MGYIPQAMVNYLALLGWGDGTENEFFTTDDLGFFLIFFFLSCKMLLLLLSFYNLCDFPWLQNFDGFSHEFAVINMNISCTAALFFCKRSVLFLQLCSMLTKYFLFDVQPAIVVSICSSMRLDKFSLLGRAQPPLRRHMLLGDHHKLFARRVQSKNLGYVSTKN
jgi:hypothetical protein